MKAWALGWFVAGALSTTVVPAARWLGRRLAKLITGPDL